MYVNTLYCPYCTYSLNTICAVGKIYVTKNRLKTQLDDVIAILYSVLLFITFSDLYIALITV